MATRSRQQQPAVAQLLLDKAWQALRSFQADIATQRTAAGALLQQVSAQRPDDDGQARQLFECYEFRALARLASKQRKIDSPDSVAGLTRMLQATREDQDLPGSDDAQELKAVHHFREALQRQHADRLVTQAIMAAPQDAGPLNPQKLALRSLAIMRDESPAYLARFVSYVDAVFWLERLDTLPPTQ